MNDTFDQQFKRSDAMDFIERLFGFSPDGGDGSAEIIYLAVLVIVAALSWRHVARKISSGSSV
jgi:hypothetical protein